MKPFFPKRFLSPLILLASRASPRERHLRTTSVLCLFSSDSGLEDVLAADDADSEIVDLDRIK
jgi:hypothetical protein